MRSEQFAMQLIETCDNIFKKRRLQLKLQCYEIMSTGEDCGFVEVIKNSMSIDYIKQKLTKIAEKEVSLYDFYQVKFNNSLDANHKKIYQSAINNLADSLAAYSLICYILQIKDRHNGNILINQNNGQLVHIDFGFILTSRLMNLEVAPFKITHDIIKLLGGLEGVGFKRFRDRMVEGYQALHEDNEKIVILVQMVAQS